MLQPLDEHPPLPGVRAGAVAAAVAAGVGDLHDAGSVHGALGPDRVLVDEAGAVSLLPAVDPVGPDMRPADDIAALGRLLAWLAERAPDRPVRPRPGLLRVLHPAELLAELAHRCLASPASARPSAHAVADTLYRRLPDARLSMPSPADTPPARAVRRAAFGSVAAVVLFGALLAFARCAASSAAPPNPKPLAESIGWTDGVLTVGSRRYSVGEPGDEVLVDRWQCGPTSVALLRRATGEVVAFDRLPEHGQPTTGRVLARAPDALQLVRRRTPDGCPSFAVATADGRTVPLKWKEAP